jgi:hypothetical protein
MLLSQGLSTSGWASLPIPAAAEAWRQRASWLQQAEASATGSSSLPDLSSKALMDNLSTWLGPHLAGVRNAGQLQKLPWKDILKGQVCGEVSFKVGKYDGTLVATHRWHGATAACGGPWLRQHVRG